jgi:hypothetical protein
MRRALLVALATAVVAGAAALPAGAADGFSLQFAGPTTGTVGKPVLLTVAGKNPPPADYWFMSWLSVDLLRPQAVPTCPESGQAANQLATGTGGAILTIAQREDVDVNGNFSVPVGFTPLVPGPLLICAYSSNEVGGVLAAATTTVTSKAAPKPKRKRRHRHR